MGYSNFSKVASSEGYAVGAPASEREVINSSGAFYVSKRKNNGSVVLTSVTKSATAKGTFNKTTNTVTLTKKVTLTRPVHFYKFKVVGKTGANAAVKVLGSLNGTNVIKTTATKSATKGTTTGTNTAPVTGKGVSPVFTAKVKATLDTTLTGTNTKKCTLSLALLSVDALVKHTLAAIT